jgi:hypothetical protein
MEGKATGSREIYARSPIGEPAEFERVTRGVAKIPDLAQRYMLLNGDRHELPPDSYNCDGCGCEIKPGEKCGTWTVWTESQREPPSWEGEYIEVLG